MFMDSMALALMHQDFLYYHSGVSKLLRLLVILLSIKKLGIKNESWVGMWAKELS